MAGRPPGKAPPLTDEQRAFIVRNERYVLPTLRRIGHPAGIDEDDLHGVAVDALIRAARSYDPGRGANEASWAITCMKWDLVAWLRQQPGGARACKRGEVSLSSPIKAGKFHCAVYVEDITLGDVLRGMDESDLVSCVERAALRDAIANLPERERVAVEGRLDGATFAEIGDRLGVSASRVSQLHDQAVRRLARLLDRWRE